MDFVLVSANRFALYSEADALRRAWQPADSNGRGRAMRRGCSGAWLDAFSFQARGFYEKLGYAVFGSIEDYPPGHSRFFLKKTFLE